MKQNVLTTKPAKAHRVTMSGDDGNAALNSEVVHENERNKRRSSETSTTRKNQAKCVFTRR